jgi:Fe-S-cluster containining protein
MDSPNRDMCEECGAFCCRYMTYPKKGATKEYIEYHDAQNSLKEKDEEYWIIDRPCPHIRDDHKCDIYSTRPKFCAEFPTDKAPSSWFKFCEYLRTYPPPKRGEMKVL